MPKNSSIHQIRIIGGQWKRTPLTVLDAEGLRPTPDRVRETLFNWLNFLLSADWQEINCLDLFAGSGALGLEAASRGAVAVTLVEQHGPALRQLEAVKTRLQASQVQIIPGDAITATKRMVGQGMQFDLIFLDPPYHRNLLEKVLPDCVQLLKQTGLLYLEAETTLREDDLPVCLNNWQIIRSDKAGQVHFHLLQRR
jgi:16S rRNA (guanine966-N2)-methyltransferase